MSNLSKLIIAVFFLLICGFSSRSQDPATRFKTNLIPASPTAANLAKYGDIPLNMYTGKANIAIPVFDVEGRDLSLPLSFTYNYSGMRPLDQVSWIGMGWSLQAGGVITVNVRGIPDGTAAPGRNYDDLADTIVKASTNKLLLKTVMETAAYDLEPDLYSFNFANYSGKFMKIKGKFICFPANKYKITGSGSLGFTITTEDGNSYSFFAGESTSQKLTSSGFSYGSYISAWYLSDVANASKTEQMTLTYVSEGILTQGGTLSQMYTEVQSTPPADGSYTQTQLFPMQGSMQTKVNCLRLSSIISEKYRVEFGPEATPRKDIGSVEGSFYALKDVRVYNLENALVKEIVLRHGYFEGMYAKALRLNSMVQYDRQNQTTDSLVHSFVYEGESFPDKSLTVGIDHYGFYNGIPATKLIPFGIIYGPDTVKYYTNGANREPVFNAAVQGALKKIYYPTGGYVTFDYENNRFELGKINPITSQPYTYDAYGIRVRQIINYPITGVQLLQPINMQKGRLFQRLMILKLLKSLFIPDLVFMKL